MANLVLQFEGYLLVRVSNNQPIAFEVELRDLIAHAEEDYCDNPDGYFCDIFYDSPSEGQKVVEFYMNYTGDTRLHPLYYAYKFKGVLK